MPGSSFSENLLYLLCGLGILQGILLAGLIYFHKRSDKTVTTYLALYILSTSAIMMLPMLIQLTGWQKSYYAMPLPLLGGPLLYLYIRSFKESITWRKAIPHFILFFVFFLLAYINLNAASGKYPDAATIPAEVINKPFTIALGILRTAQQVFYYFLARKTLKTYQRSIKQVYSETSRIDLNWARFLLNGYLILLLAGVMAFQLVMRYPQHVNFILLSLMCLGTPYIYLATYKGVTQPTIWQVQPEKTKEIVEKELSEVAGTVSKNGNDEIKAPAKPAPEENKLSVLAEGIMKLIKTEKIYQEPELTLQQLATKLNSPAYLVSQAINDELKKSFYDLVNGYRVEEAKRLLLHPDNRNYTILSVGFEAGFNSKTTFNTVFKKFTGNTPTEFRDKNKTAVPA